MSGSGIRKRLQAGTEIPTLLWQRASFGTKDVTLGDDPKKKEKRRKKAQETLQFYVPWAESIGANHLADRLRVLCAAQLVD